MSYARIAAAMALYLLCCGHAGAAGLRVTVRDPNGAALSDAVVTAVPLDRAALASAAARLPKDSVDQIDKQFVPYVKVIQAGSLVHFPNKDNIRHHVYSFSPAKTFELPLYSGTTAPPVLFDKPGVVVLGCNIHDWMIGYIYVAPTPYFSKTESSGQATLEDLPGGDYTVRVWHPRMEGAEESTARRVTLSGNAPLDLQWQLPLKPAYRIPRTSGSPGSGYR